MGSYELSERSRRLLATLVREYIETGEPVASQQLARRSRLGLSSATVRNILAQLEEAEYLHQPHTSAGRVPTDRAYRVFVDLLLEGRKQARPSPEVETRLRRQAERSPMMGDVLASASHLVSRAARHVGFALSGSPSAVLERIEFVALGGSRVLVVVISRGDQIMQKVVDTGEDIHSDDLVHAANYLNIEFSGLPLIDVREAVLARLQQDRTCTTSCSHARSESHARRWPTCRNRTRSMWKVRRPCSGATASPACRWRRFARCSR